MSSNNVSQVRELTDQLISLYKQYEQSSDDNQANEIKALVQKINALNDEILKTGSGKSWSCDSSESYSQASVK